MRYLIVIPTIRQSLPGFDLAMAAIESSLTQPTNLRILDGSAGKVEALNSAYDDLLVPFNGEVYVTMDDDFIPPKGWQDALDAGFGALPEVGMLSVWLGNGPVELNYMGASLVGPEQTRDGVRHRLVLGNHHIPGYMLAFRKEVALQVGKLPQSDLKYQIWEDAWRGRRVLKLGKRLAYIVTDELPKMVEYEDRPEYVESKERDLASGRLIEDRMLDAGGVGDNWLLKLRKRIARLRGRAGGS